MRLDTFGLLLFLPLPLQPVAEPSSTADTLTAGPLVLEVHVSRTAHLFHVVDQVAEWSPFCHTQYRAALEPLSAEDETLLARHARLRERRGWGGGLEQTFYTAAPLDEALATGVEAGWIEAEEAELERLVLTHFAERVEHLINAERERVAEFGRRIARELRALEALAVRLAALVGRSPEPVPVFLLANPAANDFGGGFNGGRLTLEVPREADAFGTFLHELTHVFLDLRRADIEAAVRNRDAPFDTQTVNEGIAHALSPGIHHAAGAGRDPLVERVRQLEERGQELTDYDLRVHRYALALRPLVREMLTDEALTFDTFLARSIETWTVVVELELVRARTRGR